MKILLISANNSNVTRVGGKHIHQELLVKGWKEKCHYIKKIYPKEYSGIKFQIKETKEKIIRAIKYEKKSDFFIRLVENKINELTRLAINELSIETFDYISAQDVMAALASQRALSKVNKRIPIYLTLHGYFAREAINYSSFPKNQESNVLEFGYNIEKEAIGNVNGIVTVDTRLKQYVIEEFEFGKKLKVIYNSIDDKRFHPVNLRTKNMLRNQLGISDQKKVALVARRLVRKNGVIFSLKAFHELIKREEKNILLCIVGDGPERKNIEKYAVENNLMDYVKFMGAIDHDQIDVFYKMTDILLMPSIKSDDVEEATSLSMLEGMICGKVVIASAIGGMKEVINDYQNGLLVEEQSPMDLANKISEVFNNSQLIQGISNSSYIYAKENHGYMSHAEEFLDFYRD